LTSTTPDARATAQPFAGIAPYLDFAQERIDAAREALYELRRADGILEALADALGDAEQLAPGWRDSLQLSESEEAQLLRRLGRVRAARRQLVLDGPATAPPAFLTVPELAEAIGVSEATARTYLERGLIPGARKADPSRPKSRWIIPADAPTRYLEGGSDDGSREA